MKKVLSIIVAALALALAGTAAAGIVDERTGVAGSGDVAAVHLASLVGPTTAYAIGVWSSREVAAPVQVTYRVFCQDPANNRDGSLTLLAGRFVSDEALLFTASPAIAGPWYGWDTCVIDVSLTQTASADNDVALVAWLASHNGS